MASSIVRLTKLSIKLQTAPIDYACETAAKLRQSRSWNFGRLSKRGRLEIMVEILCYCDQQKSKTKVMYKTKLNYAQLKTQLNSLTSKGLLATNTNKYFATQKGYRFLEIFAQLNAMLKN